jgi:hypothetical protein
MRIDIQVRSAAALPCQGFYTVCVTTGSWATFYEEISDFLEPRIYGDRHWPRRFVLAVPIATDELAKTVPETGVR